MEQLKSMGLDPELLPEDLMQKLESIGRRAGPNPSPQRLLSLLQQEGIDIPSLMDRMKVKKEPKISVRIGRNEKCPCGSNKKYKKCCIDK